MEFSSKEEATYDLLVNTKVGEIKQIIIIIIIIIIITRPRPAFGRLGLGGSSKGYSSHG